MKRLLVSCEHGANSVPKEFARQFVGAKDVLATHRGYDLGAADVARAFGRRLGVEPFIATTTRLVVDLNRSPGNRNVFSAYTRSLTPAQRGAALAAHYWPYRSAVEDAVASAVARSGNVLHVSAHSFTPELRGEVRNCDVGFLYDPRRPGEVRFIEAWYAALEAAAPQLVLRRNYPYRGVSDALVTHLRRRYGMRGYLGMELELNQKHVGSRGWRRLVAVLGATLVTACDAV
ncbi:MAG TPA: N-formylglutamate amidohydrolase [Gammaproteobacteria bacterium]|nr:N-formylglutamate amidohydrolase [Gammaproteobacteria bacterium]